MSRVKPIAIAELSTDLQEVMSAGEEIMGFTPNDGLIMARNPAMLKAFLDLVKSLYQPSAVSTELKKLVGLMTSSAAGCQYCKAHTSYGALSAGVDAQKIEAIWEYQTHPLFSDAERAALDLARDAALVPNGVTQAQFEKLRMHFSDDQIVELVGIISLFGFLNRWNATLATEIEPTVQEGISVLNK